MRAQHLLRCLQPWFSSKCGGLLTWSITSLGIIIHNNDRHSVEYTRALTQSVQFLKHTFWGWGTAYQALHSLSGQDANTARIAEVLPPVKKSRWRSTSMGRTLLQSTRTGMGLNPRIYTHSALIQCNLRGQHAFSLIYNTSGWFHETMCNELEFFKLEPQ
jgi:hypothetical protein